MQPKRWIQILFCTALLALPGGVLLSDVPLCDGTAPTSDYCGTLSWCSQEPGCPGIAVAQVWAQYMCNFDGTPSTRCDATDTLITCTLKYECAWDGMACNPAGSPTVNSVVHKSDYVTCLDQS